MEGKRGPQRDKEENIQYRVHGAEGPAQKTGVRLHRAWLFRPQGCETYCKQTSRRKGESAPA